MKLFDNVKAVMSIRPAAARAADANGESVDTLGFRDGMLVVEAGVIDTTDANETYAFLVEESDTGSGAWTAVPGATGAITASNTTDVIRVAELNVARKRYLRAVLDVGGTSPSILCSAVFLLGEAYAGPVNND